MTASCDGKRFVVRADEKLTPFIELESERVWINIGDKTMWTGPPAAHDAVTEAADKDTTAANNYEVQHFLATP
jgi:hypothetical protein